MSYPALPGIPYRITISATVSRAYRATLDNLPLLIMAAWLPLLLILAAEVIGLALGSAGFLGRVMAAPLRAAAVLAFGTVFAVRVHRLALLNETPSGELFPNGWWPFLITGLKLGGLIVVAAIVLTLIAVLPPHLLTAPMVIVGSISLGLASLRVSLVFPAAAIERTITFRAAWDLLAGNYWRLLACSFCCYVPFGIAEAIVRLIGDAMPSLIGIVFQAVGLAASFAGFAVFATMLSEVYQRIAGVDSSRIAGAAD
jgi:hypothetical protein